MFDYHGSEIRGVLCDFDLDDWRSDLEQALNSERVQVANIRSGATDPLTCPSEYQGWTGTLPLVSRELLTRGITPVQTTRHDYESLLSVLVCHLATHDPRMAGYVRDLEQWLQDDYRKVGDMKADFIKKAAGSREDQDQLRAAYFSEVYGGCKDLADQWVWRLAELFLWSAHNFNMEPEDYKTDLPHRPRDNVLYARFLAIIGGEVDSTCGCEDNEPLMLEDNDILEDIDTDSEDDTDSGSGRVPDHGFTVVLTPLFLYPYCECMSHLGRYFASRLHAVFLQTMNVFCAIVDYAVLKPRSHPIIIRRISEAFKFLLHMVIELESFRITRPHCAS